MFPVIFFMVILKKKVRLSVVKHLNLSSVFIDISVTLAWLQWLLFDKHWKNWKHCFYLSFSWSTKVQVHYEKMTDSFFFFFWWICIQILSVWFGLRAPDKCSNFNWRHWIFFTWFVAVISRLLQGPQSSHHGGPGHSTSGCSIHRDGQRLLQRSRPQQVCDHDQYSEYFVICTVNLVVVLST